MGCGASTPEQQDSKVARPGPPGVVTYSQPVPGYGPPGYAPPAPGYGYAAPPPGYGYGAPPPGYGYAQPPPPGYGYGQPQTVMQPQQQNQRGGGMGMVAAGGVGVAGGLIGGLLIADAMDGDGGFF